MRVRDDWEQFVENVLNKAKSMPTDSMDYAMIWYFYRHIKDGPIPINKMIDDYGESYFRELIETLKPWSPQYRKTLG